MSCSAFEPLIALYAGRDLDRRDNTRVEEHLAACPDCRELLEDLQASQAALKDLGSDAVDAALLTAVRSGVLAGIGDRRRTVWPWIAALAAAAAVLMVAPRKPVTEPAPLPAPVAQTARVFERQAEPPAPPATRRRRVAKRAPAPEVEPLVVKMLTDDPDIVIIWLVDQRGD